MRTRPRSRCAGAWSRILVFAVVLLSVLAALGVERLSYRWCPRMGAMWTACCDGAGSGHDELADAPKIVAPCCESRGFKALPRGEQVAPRRALVLASEVATTQPMFVASIDVDEVTPPPPGAGPRGGLPPPSRQRRLALISLLRL